MLDLHQLQVFIAAAELLNFSKAGVRLHLSQPSITQHIQNLESQLGYPLFNRKSHQLTLTEYGLALLPLARRLVITSLRTEEMMTGFLEEVSGHLHIGCSTTPGKYQLPMLMADFMQKFPMVKATCHVDSRNHVLKMLANGTVDVALSSSHEEFDGNLEFLKFLTEPVVLVVPNGHPWEKIAPIELSELKNERFIMREETSGTYRVVRDALARKGFNINDLQVRLSLGNSEAIAIAVRQGIGAGFMSKSVYDNMVGEKATMIQIKGLEIDQDIYICRNRLRSSGNVLNKFWEFVSRRIEKTEEKQ